MSGEQFGQLKKFKLVFLGEQSGNFWLIIISIGSVEFFIYKIIFE